MKTLLNPCGKLWTIGLPVLFFITVLFFDRVLDSRCFTACEDGPVENFQALLAFAGFAVGLYLVTAAPHEAYPRWARGFFLLGSFACLYIGLEEISYGQRIFGWGTPEAWDAVNDQQETNLHNASSWLDQKPRLFLMIGVLIGGVMLPLLRRYRPASLPQRWAAIYPEHGVFLTAITMTALKIYDVTIAALHHPEFFLSKRDSEFQELYLYYFLLLYLAQKAYRFRRRRAT